jgi:hypothetical protein
MEGELASPCMDWPGVKELAGQVIFLACASLYVGR